MQKGWLSPAFREDFPNHAPNPLAPDFFNKPVEAPHSMASCCVLSNISKLPLNTVKKSKQKKGAFGRQKALLTAK